MDLVEGAGYHFFREGPTFLQFNLPGAQFLDLDLMLVGDETFAKLMADAVPAPASPEGARVVSLRHLLALKCHAIKHGHQGRIVKDADDVIRLAQANHLDLNEPGMRDLFLKHGTGESVHKAEDTELNLPDWSGMDDTSARISPDAAFALCEQYGSWRSQLADKWRSQRSEKCLVEFVR